MKKLISSLGVAAALVAAASLSAPAQAQRYYGPAAHNGSDWRRPATMPYGHYYGGGYYYAPPVVVVPPLLCLVLCHRHSNKPANGELKTLPDGTTVSYDKASNRWIVVDRGNGPVPSEQ